MASIIIIGAGLTGISTAYHLEKLGITDYKLFEKKAQHGGLCQSITQDGFTFDFTGHLLHIGDAYFRSLIEKEIGLDQFNSINRRSFVYSQNTYTAYPYQINLHGLPAQTIVECIQGYSNRPSIEKPATFREWVMSNFGSGFGKYFFFPYQEKIFAYDIDKLTASWTSKFVPGTSLEQILYGALLPEEKAPVGNASVGYNAQFFYPKQGGIYSWVRTFAQKITQPIATDMSVQAIHPHRKEILFSNGHVESYDILINTMPLDQLVTRLKEPSNGFLYQARDHLKCNQVVNFNIGLNYPISSKHWVYYPEKKYPFYRIGFPHNFADSMAPAGCSSLYGEFSHMNQSPEWVDQMLTHSIDTVKRLFKFDTSNIATQVIIPISHAYVIFDQWRDTHLPHIHSRLHEYNIYSIGRYGAWKYASMQDAVLDGKAMAETIAQSHEMGPHAFDTKHDSPELTG